MNEKLSIMFSRRSVRRYTEQPVADSVVRDLLEAAMAAPSAVARDPWRFIVIRDSDTLARAAEGLPNGKMLSSAAVGFVICGEQAAAHDGQLSYLLQDCAAAIENLLLAANALGLGACWLGVHPRVERLAHLREVLGIPEDVLPISAIAVGYPAEAPAPRTRYDEAKVHHDRW